MVVKIPPSFDKFTGNVTLVVNVTDSLRLPNNTLLSCKLFIPWLIVFDICMVLGCWLYDSEPIGRVTSISSRHHSLYH